LTIFETVGCSRNIIPYETDDFYAVKATDSCYGIELKLAYSSTGRCKV